MSSPLDTIAESNAIKSELQKRVFELSEENEQLESSCYTQRIITITLALLLSGSVALNFMLYDANGSFEAEMAKQNEIIFVQSDLISDKQSELNECKLNCQYMADGMEEAIEKGFVQKMPPAIKKDGR